MKNALSIDLEDYYHVSAFRNTVAEKDWGTQESRVERNTDVLLSFLDEASCKATFFILGSVASNFPHLVKRIAKEGHEVACHSLRHHVVYEMTTEEFRDDARRAKEVIEDAAGSRVWGYRAPSFSITEDSLWAFDVLASLGFTFDSSIFPVKHPNYGIPGISRFPFVVNTDHGPIVEFPMPSLEIAGRRAPLGGGAYLRLLPYSYTKWGIRYLNKRENRPVCVYLHPWEIDPQQPRLDGPLTSRLRHTFGLRGLERKLRNLLRDFEFCPLHSLLSEVGPIEPSLTLDEFVGRYRFVSDSGILSGTE